MKNKLHLVYGIIIGVLACASIGARSSNADQSGFTELRLVNKWDVPGELWLDSEFKKHDGRELDQQDVTLKWIHSQG